MKPAVETVKPTVIRGRIESMSTLTITEFLEARIAEDEALAEDCLTLKALTPYSDERIPPVQPEEWGGLVDNYLGGEMGKYCAHNHPIRVLAECAAKRAIINLADEALRAQADRRDASALGAELMHDDVLCALAAVYADHADYRQEWKL